MCYRLFKDVCLFHSCYSPPGTSDAAPHHCSNAKEVPHLCIT
ncbi:unnamed protein product [Ranitomeya imitator]|uniref:Uncharacterized protein n=1 Tax=Ranitomeya imitator TaxID=111125 RepID=A0ABN9KWJ5_9NEOB|nr:unnamed protein product [Ranitomeya imitator]